MIKKVTLNMKNTGYLIWCLKSYKCYIIYFNYVKNEIKAYILNSIIDGNKLNEVNKNNSYSNKRHITKSENSRKYYFATFKQKE